MPQFPERAAALARELQIQPLFGRILASRGFSSTAEALPYLHPTLSRIEDPFAMRDMDKAVERIARAIAQNERIAIFGDYDVDGLTSTSLLLRMFDFLGVKADHHIPHRLLEGYGMNIAALEAMHQRGVRLLITVDNGVSSLEEIEFANSLGMDVIVTDHHMPGERLPAAVAVVDPNRADCTYPCPHLAGVGVAFKLAYALLIHLKKPAEQYKPFIRECLDLVGLGTISDIVPLTGENRILAHYGLKEARQSQKAGLRALREVLGLEGESLSPRAIGFIIGPRLNAAGRTGYADIALDLLMTEDMEHARKIVGILSQLNDERRAIEQDILEQAIERVETNPALRSDPVLVIEGINWHHGVIGIVASRLLGQYCRPTIVLAVEGEHVKGSARSIAGFDIIDAIGACQQHLLGFGGHSLAAGLQMRTDNIDNFRHAINRYAADYFEKTPPRHCLNIDTLATVEEITCECCETLLQMEPHGAENPKPVVAVHNVMIAEPPRMVGRSSEHLRLTVGANGQTLNAIGFHLTESNRWIFHHHGPIDIAGTPCINEHNGRRMVQIELRDVRPSQIMDSAD